jgi:hypothetical protein
MQQAFIDFMGDAAIFATCCSGTVWCLLKVEYRGHQAKSLSPTSLFFITFTSSSFMLFGVLVFWCFVVFLFELPTCSLFWFV